jgi:hypothetical protein
MQFITFKYLHHATTIRSYYTYYLLFAYKVIYILGLEIGISTLSKYKKVLSIVD